MMILENLLQVFIAFHVPIQIIVEMLKYDDYMLPKFKAVQKLNDSFSAFTFTFHQFFK